MCGAFSVTSAVLAERWLKILERGIESDYSQQRHDALKQVDTRTAKGVRALSSVLETQGRDDPLRFDWFVREGAYEALSKVRGKEARKEILDILEGKGNTYTKEAIIYSVIWKIRKQFVKDYGGIDDDKIEEAKKLLRKTRGLEYFKMMLPRLKQYDPKRRKFKWIKLAFKDSNTRVRLASLQGFLAYPQNSTIPLLIENLEHLKKKEKKKKATKRIYYREWVTTRHVLEQLTGEFFDDNVEDWRKWWDVAKGQFSLKKRIAKEEKKKKDGSKTIVVKRGGVEVAINMKIAGKGYPLLVLPWRGFEPDYFRPYFHGIEAFSRVYYLLMPNLDDFKGLARGDSNLINYPTEKLAEVLAGYMEEIGQKRFAILGHGPGSCTLAMMLAAKLEKSVSHLILINPNSAGKEYINILQGIKRLGKSIRNREVEKGGESVILLENNKHEYEPADSAEAQGLGRALRNLRRKDPTAPEIGLMNFLYSRTGGQSVMNDSSWTIRSIFNGKKPKLPVMISMGEKAPFSPLNTMMRVADYFPKSFVAKFRKGSEFPFLFDTYNFTKQVEKFFKKYPPEKMKLKKKKRKK